MSSKRAVTRNVLALVLVVIIVVVAGFAAFRLMNPTPSTTTQTAMSSTTSQAFPDELVYDESDSPVTTDPGVAINNPDLEVTENTNPPLVFFNASDNAIAHLLPVLAESWSGSPDGRTYTFYLRNNVYYSNGNPFNAYVVWWNIYRDLFMNQPNDALLYLYFNTTGVTVDEVNSLNNAQNVPDANLLRVMQNPHNCVTVINSTVVQFHLTSSFAGFMATIEDPPWGFVDPYTVEQQGGVVADEPNTWMALHGSDVGSGPYIVQAFVPNQYVILVANPNYWAQNISSSDRGYLVLQPPHIHRIVINYKTDELTRSLDLESGKAQAAIIAFNDIKNVLSSGKQLYIPNTGLSGSMEFIMIDTLRPPTDNIYLRRAIIAAINITQIQSVVYQGYAVPVVGPLAHGISGYNESIAPTPYNVTEAKLLLEKAGYPNGQGLPPIEFLYPTSAYLSLIATLIKQDLAQIGITLEPREVPSSTYWDLTAIPGENSTAPLIAFGSWTWYPDFSGYEFIVSEQLAAYMNLNNQTINDLIYKSNSETDPTLRAQEISQITLMVQQQAADIWLGQLTDLYDTGSGSGPTVWNTCVSGMWYNTAWDGLAFNAVYYTCTPAS
jgi:peptide/nickel transport system substrate-binding protein